MAHDLVCRIVNQVEEEGEKKGGGLLLKEATKERDYIGTVRMR